MSEKTYIYHVRNLQVDRAAGGWMLQGWSTDSCKNFFKQMTTSDAIALQNLLKMKIFACVFIDFPRSTLKLRVGQNLVPSLV